MKDLRVENATGWDLKVMTADGKLKQFEDSLSKVTSVKQGMLTPKEQVKADEAKAKAAAEAKTQEDQTKAKAADMASARNQAIQEKQATLTKLEGQWETLSADARKDTRDEMQKAVDDADKAHSEAKVAVSELKADDAIAWDTKLANADAKLHQFEVSIAKVSSMRLATTQPSQP